MPMLESPSSTSSPRPPSAADSGSVDRVDRAGAARNRRPQNGPEDVCAVCGAAVEQDGEIEDSNGWRWYSDGQGGLLPLCPACPPPAIATEPS